MIWLLAGACVVVLVGIGAVGIWAFGMFQLEQDGSYHHNSRSGGKHRKEG